MTTRPLKELSDADLLAMCEGHKQFARMVYDRSLGLARKEGLSGKDAVQRVMDELGPDPSIKEGPVPGFRPCCHERDLRFLDRKHGS